MGKKSVKTSRKAKAEQNYNNVKQIELTEPIENGGQVSEVLEVSEVAEVERCKHPLEHSWSFWLQANNKEDWKENLIEVTTFDTVEDYWCLYHYTKTPSELTVGQDYAIFKKGILPMWEDQANRSGGRWLVMVERGNRAQLDKIWLDAVLMMIGQNFEDNDSITGVVVYIRPYSKIGVWTKDSKDTEANLRIGKELKATFGLRRKLEYQPHDTSIILHTI